jgi:hypothetical protein
MFKSPDPPVWRPSGADTYTREPRPVKGRGSGSPFIARGGGEWKGGSASANTAACQRFLRRLTLTMLQRQRAQPPRIGFAYVRELDDQLGDGQLLRGLAINQSEVCPKRLRTRLTSARCLLDQTRHRGREMVEWARQGSWTRVKKRRTDSQVGQAA